MAYENEYYCEPICNIPNNDVLYTGFYNDYSNTNNGCINGTCIAPNICKCYDGFKLSELNYHTCVETNINNKFLRELEPSSVIQIRNISIGIGICIFVIAIVIFIVLYRKCKVKDLGKFLVLFMYFYVLVDLSSHNDTIFIQWKYRRIMDMEKNVFVLMYKIFIHYIACS